MTTADEIPDATAAYERFLAGGAATELLSVVRGSCGHDYPWRHRVRDHAFHEIVLVLAELFEESDQVRVLEANGEQSSGSMSADARFCSDG